jgi:AraC-like DNA-binding protein
MENAVSNMELKQFMRLFSDKQQRALGDDFCIVNVRYDQNLRDFMLPVRVDAYLVLFCMSGSVRLNVNMKEFMLEKDQLTLLIPGYICQVVDYDRQHPEEIQYVLVGMSRRLLSALHLDLNQLFDDGSLILETPSVTLTAEEKSIAVRYLNLAKVILESSLSNKRECMGSLISSIFVLSEGIFSRQIEKAIKEEKARFSRAEGVFSKFLRLLSEFHMQERNVSFYAGKLALSPKYLSKLIKQASGRSAPEWINSFVTLEAKNLLRYSDMSIKEIVYRLHFSDQPSFTKFFKSHTGLTPAQFRKQI